MKKIITLFGILLCLSLLFAQTDERKAIMNYYKNQDFSNFLKAVSYYGTKNEMNQDFTSQTYMMSLLFNELNKTLNNLVVNADSLAPGELFQTANTLLALGENEKAIKLYDKINNKTPNWSCPWRHKGEAYLKIEDYKNSETSLLKAIETRKDHYDAYLMLAEVYYKQNNFKQAYDTMQESFKYKSSGAEEAEESFSEKDADLLYLEILKANKMKKEAKILEDNINKKYN